MSTKTPLPGLELSQNIQRAQHVAEMLKALAHPIRLQIIAVLCEGREHVTGLAERLEVPQAIISQQLRILRMRGLVLTERVDGFAYYSLGEPQLEGLVHCMEGCSIR